MRLCATYMLVACLATLCGGGACALDSLQTDAGRRQGTLALQKGQLLLDGHPVPWASVLVVTVAHNLSRVPEPNVLHLRNGESWMCRVIRVERDEVQLLSGALGLRTVSLKRVGMIDFRQGLSTEQQAEKQTLYRKGGNVLSGEVLWMSPERLGVKSVLGTVAVPREDCERYVFARTYSGHVREGRDELRLIDGSRLLGAVRPAGAGWKVEHKELGVLQIPFNLVRSVVRGVKRVSYFTMRRVKEGTLAPPLSQKTTKFVPETFTDSSSGCAQWMRLPLGSRSVFRLPKANGTPQVLRALFRLAPQARGAAVLQVQADGQAVFSKTILSGQDAQPLSLKLPPSKTLVFLVEASGVPQFPGDVWLGDPHVMPYRPPAPPPPSDVVKENVPTADVSREATAPTTAKKQKTPAPVKP